MKTSLLFAFLPLLAVAQAPYQTVSPALNMFAVTSGCAMLSGETMQMFSAYPDTGFVLKTCDASGAILDMALYSSPVLNEGTLGDLTSDPDGGVTLAVAVSQEVLQWNNMDLDTLRTEMLLAHILDNGYWEWSKLITRDSIAQSISLYPENQLTSVEVTRDSQNSTFLLLRTGGSTVLENSRAFVMKFDAQGDPLWSRSLSPVISGSWDTELCADGTGGCYFGMGPNMLAVGHLSATGALEWWNTHTYTFGQGWIQSRMDMALLPNGDLRCFARIGFGNADGIGVFNLNQLGDLLQADRYAGCLLFMDVEAGFVTSDGGCVVVAKAPGMPHREFLHLDSSGAIVSAAIQAPFQQGGLDYADGLSYASYDLSAGTLHGFGHFTKTDPFWGTTWTYDRQFGLELPSFMSCTTNPCVMNRTSIPVSYFTTQPMPQSSAVNVAITSQDYMPLVSPVAIPVHEDLCELILDIPDPTTTEEDVFVAPSAVLLGEPITVRSPAAGRLALLDNSGKMIRQAVGSVGTSTLPTGDLARGAYVVLFQPLSGAPGVRTKVVIL